MAIPMLADTTTNIAKSYGCLIEDQGIAFRATYIIDDKGILRHMTIGDLPVGRNVDEFVRLVQAFKHTDEFGEVCPSKWTPGAATMVPDPDSKKTEEYWENEYGK